MWRCCGAGGKLHGFEPGVDAERVDGDTGSWAGSWAGNVSTTPWDMGLTQDSDGSCGRTIQDSHNRGRLNAWQREMRWL